MTKDFKMIQDVVKCLAGVDVTCIRGSDEQILNTIISVHRDALQSAASDKMIVRVFRNMRPGCIYELKGFLRICFLVVYDDTDDHYLVLGPCLMEPLMEAELRLLLKHSRLEPEVCRVLEDYTRQLPVVPYETFHLLGTLLAHHLYDLPRPVPYQQLEYEWDVDKRRNIPFVDRYEEVDHMRRVELRYEISAALTEAVKQGNLSLAFQMLQQMNPNTDGIVRNPSPLRNSQNMCIIINTHLRHAMEDCGIHPYRLDRFSNEIALQIEKFKTPLDAAKFAMEIIRRYCELARENTYKDLKPFARLAVTYIKEHLSDNLTVKETARALMVNANYLSYQFHQEMGITFIDFVNRERVRQAAALLKHTNMQVQQIAATVGYNNTSYFAKQFVKYQNMTPRVFRNSGAL